MGKRLTHEEYLERVRKAHDGDVEVLSDYTKSDCKMQFRRKSCGHEFTAWARDISERRITCPICNSVARLSQEEFIRRVNETQNGELTVLGEYTRTTGKIRVRHSCGYEWQTICSTALYRSGCCPKCSKKAVPTQEEFVQKVNEIHHGEIEVLGTYTRTRDKVLFRHRICGTEFYTATNNVTSGKTRCPKCAPNAQITHEEFCDKCPDDIEVLGEFEGMSKKIHVRYSCGHEGHPYAHDILNGHRCMKCKNRKTHDEYVKELRQKYNDEYTILGKYTTVYTKTMHRHNSCGYCWEIRPSSFLAGQIIKCPRCSDTRRTHKEYLKEVQEIHGDSIKVLGQYESLTVPILHEHSCGHRWMVKPKLILKGHSCHACFKAEKKTPEQYKEELDRKFNEEYTVLEPYKGATVKILHRHNKCLTEWSVKPNTLLSKAGGCPFCKESKGERLIREFLDKQGWKFERQHKFDDCRGRKRPLPFDFAVFKNGELFILVEWDGRQHFEPVKAFDGEKGLREIQEHDKIKNEYCESRGIPLVRIPYWMKPKQAEKMLYSALQDGTIMLAM